MRAASSITRLLIQLHRERVPGKEEPPASSDNTEYNQTTRIGAKKVSSMSRLFPPSLQPLTTTAHTKKKKRERDVKRSKMTRRFSSLSLLAVGKKNGSREAKFQIADYTSRLGKLMLHASSKGYHHWRARWQTPLKKYRDRLRRKENGTPSNGRTLNPTTSF